MSALRHGLGRMGLLIICMMATAANAGPLPTSTTSDFSLPPGPPGPPALQGPGGGDRLFLRPHDRPRPPGARRSIAGLIGMMEGIGTSDWAIVDEAVTSTGNENFWLSEMERSAVAAPKQVADERLATRRFQ